jgi:hypothetical protein
MGKGYDLGLGAFGAEFEEVGLAPLHQRNHEQAVFEGSTPLARRGGPCSFDLAISCQLKSGRMLGRNLHDVRRHLQRYSSLIPIPVYFPAATGSAQ